MSIEERDDAWELACSIARLVTNGKEKPTNIKELVCSLIDENKDQIDSVIDGLVNSYKRLESEGLLPQQYIDTMKKWVDDASIDYKDEKEIYKLCGQKLWDIFDKYESYRIADDITEIYGLEYHDNSINSDLAVEVEESLIGDLIATL